MDYKQRASAAKDAAKEFEPRIVKFLRNMGRANLKLAVVEQILVR
jgi:hypothetical protein